MPAAASRPNYWVVSVCLPCMQVIWNNYIDAMRQAGFSSSTGVFVASGLLTYGASQGNLTALPSLHGICST